MRGSAAFRVAVTPGGVLAGPWVRNELWRAARAVPSLDLRFADNKSLIDATTGAQLITFTRASSGTYVGSDGLIKTATTNEARFDHNPTTGESLGLLVEEQRANLVQRSEEIDNAYWSKTAASITANAIAAPDNATTADFAVPNTVSTGHFLGRTSITGATGFVYTASVFAKAGGYNFLGLSDFATGQAVFNLQTGAVISQDSGITAHTPVALPNGWWRLAITFTASTSRGIGVDIWSDGSKTTFAGDGTSGIYIWGAQLEAGSFPTSYIPTTTATVTRSADVASITGANFSSWYNQTAGTVFAEYRTPASGTRGVVGFNDNTANERIAFYTSGTDPKLTIVDGGVTQADINGGTVTASVMTKSAGAFAANDFALAHAGGAAVADTSGTMPTPDRVLIGADQAGNYQNGRIRRLTYWPARLPNSTLVEITR